MKVSFHLSDKFRNEKAIEQGRTIPREIVGSVMPADLTEECRRAVLEISTDRGTYPQHIVSIGYSKEFKPADCYSRYCWGNVDIKIDSLTPTLEEFSASILAAIGEVDAMRVEAQKKIDEAQKKAGLIQALREELSRLEG